LTDFSLRITKVGWAEKLRKQWRHFLGRRIEGSLKHADEISEATESVRVSERLGQK
jgi:hypothetical protein